MTGTFYSNFSKMKNSTKQPTGGTSVTMTLKEGTSIEKPTFILSGNQFSYNYVQAFGHYYFVEDIKSVRNGITEIECSMDVLATYKSDISSYAAFVERSSLTYDTMLPDPFVAVGNSETVDSATTSVGTIFNSTGIFVLSVLNNKGSGSGFTCYYIMGITDIEALAHYVNTDWAAGASDFFDFIKASFLNTADCIIDCIWVPYSVAAIPTGTTAGETVKIGVDNVTGVTGWRILQPCILSQTVTVTIPHVYSDFRKGNPYTSVQVFIPGYGMVDVNPLEFSDNKITLQFDGDFSTGDTVCYMKNSSGKLISTYTYNMAVPCPVGKVGANTTGFMSSAIQTVGGLIMASALPGAGGVAAGIGAASSAINTLSTALGPTASVHGGKGGRAMAQNGLDVIVTVKAKDTKDPDDLLAREGRPVMKLTTLSTLNGMYIKCSDASVPIAGMGSEKDAVNDFLNSGFYLE